MELLEEGWFADGAVVPRPGSVAKSEHTSSTLRWIARRQLPSEGGFMGRTNKIVDSCYSFWLGACAVIAAGGGRGMLTPATLHAVWSAPDTARYLFHAAQAPGGGFRDKPGKQPDAYHTCYSLAGLSLAQWQGGAAPLHDADRVEPTHPLFGVRPVRLEQAALFWGRRGAREDAHL